MHNFLTKENYKIVLSSNDDSRMQSIDWIETYAYGTSKNLDSEREEIKCNDIIKKKQKMTDIVDVIKENIKTHIWPKIPDYPYRISIVGGYGSGKTNSVFNLISQQPDINKT